MPAFLSFFSKRDSSAVLRKSPRSSFQPSPSTPTSLPPASSTKSIPSPSIAEASEHLESSELSLEAEYVLADADLSPVNSNLVYPLASNVASTSTTKLKMPFRRKQQSASAKLITVPSHPPALPPKGPHKSSVESSVSDPPSLLPPPSRSAIFGSYADPHGASSTRSLPQGVPTIHPRRSTQDVPQYYETMSDPDSHTTFTNPQSKQPSKGGLFSWARPRARTKSKPPPPDSSLKSAPVLTLPPPDSFNLKSFRHVTSPGSETSPSGSPSESDPPPPPRPRGGSQASDASQRIAVAAFREAQARRSATNSPVPSVPGDRDSVPPGQVRNRRPSALATPPAIIKTDSQPRAPLPSRPPMRNPPVRSSTAPLSFAASMTSSESSEEEESESEEEATLRPRRRRTITHRSAQSEVGFRSSPILSYGASRSDIGHGLSSGLSTRPSPSPRNNVNNSPKPEVSGSRSRSSSVYSRTHVSLSTSALVPEATKRAHPASRYSAAASRPTHAPPRSRSRASTSSEYSSGSSSSEDLPLAALQRPGSAMSRGSGPSRRPTKPLVDIGQLVGENSAIPPRAPEPSHPSRLTAEADSPAARYRKTSLGLGERLSAITGLGGLQPSRSKSPDSMTDSRDEGFTPPAIPEKPRSQSPIPSPPIIKPTSSALKSKTNKSSSATQSRSFATPKLDTLSLKHDSGISPPSSSASSNAPIPHITPTPIRERQEQPAFAVTSRPTSHASSPSTGTLAALDQASADMDKKPAPRRSASAMAEQAKEDQQQQRRPPQVDSQTTVRVVRSVPLKSPREEPLPVIRPRSRSRPPPVGVTVSNVHLTPPSPPASSLPPALRQVSNNGAVLPPRKPFVLRDSSPVSSAGDSSSSRMPITPRDGSELGAGPTGRPAIGHRQRASVTFLDEVEGERERRERERRERERELRRPSVGKRPSHGRGPPPVVSSSSDDEDTVRGRERAAEEKRRERRRSEAKAAIELGNVINGTGPIDDNDDDDDDGQPMNVPPRMSMAMGMGAGMSAGNNIPFPTGGLQGQWGGQGAAAFGGQLSNLQMQNFMNAGAGSGLAGGMDTSAGMNMGMGMGMVDPRVFAVHQQAMMIAKQTYQLAVAQQAMRDAADEWERGSAVSGWTGGRSSASTPNMLNMGMGMNMNMGGGGGMGGYPGGAGSYAMSGAGGMWPGGAIPGFSGNSARQMYSGNGYAASEVGGGGGNRGGGGGGWATSSVYGESFGAPRDRPSRQPRQSTLVQVSSPLGSGNSSGGSAVAVKGGRPRTRTAPSLGGSGGGGQRAGPGPGAANSAGGSGPVNVKKRDGPGSGGYGLVGTISPPSSWKGPP